MSVKRRELVRYLEKNAFYLLRHGSNHSIYTNDIKVISVERHKQLDRITANEICEQAGIPPKFQEPTNTTTPNSTSVIVITAAIPEILVIIYRKIFFNTIAYVQAHRNIPHPEFLRLGLGPGLHPFRFRRTSQSSRFENS